MAAGLDVRMVSRGNKALRMIDAGKFGTPFKAAERLGMSQ